MLVFANGQSYLRAFLSNLNHIKYNHITIISAHYQTVTSININFLEFNYKL